MLRYGHNQLREDFLSFFQKKGHKRLNSSSLIPAGDKTLLFTNAGMNQFKDYFLDIKTPPWANAATCQKCLRAGGKHNDLDNVGYTTRHHTFFEMLGNFSFGAYFKEQAIEFAWDFVVNILKLPVERLFVSVFTEDDEAFDIWNRNIGIDSGKIFRFGEKDNFWSMGDTGPCGPCSEIFYDMGEEYGNLSKENDERFLEIWNLVFMQFDRHSNGELNPLKKKNIDTGMGLERTLSIMEGAGSNYETSLFLPVINRLEEIFEKSYIKDQSIDCTAFRVIADHSRAISFLIADGQVPTNFSRGYVLRRIIRRAYRYGMVLGATKPFISAVIDTVIENMSNAYPELLERHKLITEVVKREEENFILTLSKGIERVYELIKKIKSDNNDVISGMDAFKLYDTYGIPVDIISDIAKDNHIKFQEKDFLNCMEDQKQKARSSSAFKINNEEFKILDDNCITSAFIGYNDDYTHITNVRGIFKENSLAEEVDEGEAFIITDQTPFYPEKGGQKGDRGLIINLADNKEIEVIDTKWLTERCIGHRVKVKSRIKLKDRIILEVDVKHRKSIERNHTATHLLHYALREVLGNFVKQSGSYLDAERLRFDFTYHRQLTNDEIREIENLIQNTVLECYEVSKEEMDYDSALQNGAIALFAEKYDNIVRVVKIGDFSIELCGGTHLRNTGEIGLFKIIQETSIASGIRRIEAITGNKLYSKVQELFFIEKTLKNKFIKGGSDIIDHINTMSETIRKKEKEIEACKLKLLSFEAESLINKSRKIGDIKLIKYKTSETNVKLLKVLMDNLKQRSKDKSIILLLSMSDNPLLLCGTTKDISNRFNADIILKKLLSRVNGKGGGRPDLAQGGLKEKTDAAVLYKDMDEILIEMIK